MKEIIVKYNDSKTLAILKALAKFFNFTISIPKKGETGKTTYEYINGVPVIPGDSTVSTAELHKIFTGKNLDARKLRTEGWRR